MYSEPTPDFTPLKPIPKQGVLAITSPATTPPAEDLERGVAYLESHGYRVEVGETCYKQHHYVAGEDQSRAFELMDFVSDGDIDAIICARGGYGSMRMLNLLDWQLFREERKPLIGFSDITALQWALYARSGIPSLSAGMVATDMARQPMNAQFETAFWELVESGRIRYPLPFQQDIPETVTGLCFAGTSSLATKLMGSSFFPDLKDAILVLEDVDEQTHKIEAYLLQMALAGLFERAQAVLLGRFRKAKTEQYPDVPELEQVFDRVFESFHKPLIRYVDYGHVDEKIPFPVGAPVSLSLGPESTIASTESIYEA